MFVSRREDGSIFGAWSTAQYDGQEELPDTHPDVVAFRDRPAAGVQRALDLEDAKAKLDLAVASAAVPPVVKDVLAALKKVLG